MSEKQGSMSDERICAMPSVIEAFNHVAALQESVANAIRFYGCKSEQNSRTFYWIGQYIDSHTGTGA
jgi:hypothetical protein